MPPLRLVREHRARDNVADRVMAFNVRAKCSSTLCGAIIKGDAELFSEHSLGEVRGPTETRTLSASNCIPLRLSWRWRPRVLFDFHRAHFGFEMDASLGAVERFLEHRFAASRNQSPARSAAKIRARSLPSRAGSNGAQFQPDRAAADDGEFLRCLLESERFRAATMDVAIKLHVGQPTGTLPVAMTMSLRSISWLSPSEGLMATRPGAVTVPRPWNVVILLLFMSIFTPLFMVFTTLSLRASIFAKSSPTVSKTMPCWRLLLSLRENSVVRSK